MQVAAQTVKSKFQENAMGKIMKLITLVSLIGSAWKFIKSRRNA